MSPLWDGCGFGPKLSAIRDGAFYGCTGLTAIEVHPDNSSYSSLDGVLFDKTLTTLIDCPEGKTGVYSIPDSVTSIGDWAFSYCTRLTSITIPDSVTSIGDHAFYGCKDLSSVYFEGPQPGVGSGVFSEAPNATAYYLPEQIGWGSSFGGRPARLWNPLLTAHVQPDGLRLALTGTADIPVLVEAGPDLVGTEWMPLFSGALAGGSVMVIDPEWAEHSARFYRVRSPE